MKVLLVGTIQHVAQFVRKGPPRRGHTVDDDGNGRDDLLLVASERYGAILLDRMLPEGING
jgi:DNA-binding response OmpR family regulator